MPNELEGVLEVMDSEVAPANSQETKTEAQTEPKTEEGVAELEAVTEEESDSGEKPKGETETETDEESEAEAPSKQTAETNSENSEETETNTETKTETENTEEAEPVDNVELSIPPEPQFNFKQPEFNEDGEITNMTPEEYYTKYLPEKAKYDIRLELWADRVENTALDAAEKILPEIKTNPAIRQQVENTRIASILSGKQINSYEAAKQVKEALGLSSSKLAQAKAEGAHNAKVSITKQKSAAVETKGTTTAKRDNPKADNLAKRLKAGDDEAFAELFEQWDEDGIL